MLCALKVGISKLNFELFRHISTYPVGEFRAISRYFELFWDISGYFGLFRDLKISWSRGRAGPGDESREIVQNRGKSYQIKMDQAAIKPGA